MMTSTRSIGMVRIFVKRTPAVFAWCVDKGGELQPKPRAHGPQLPAGS
jgi:hypothetical protein